MSDAVQTPIEQSAPHSPSSPPHKKTKIINPMPSLSVASILNADTTAPATPTPAMSAPALEVQFLAPTAKAPTRGSAFAAGYDIYASRPATIPARGRALVETDIAISVPEGTYGRVAPRSGLAVKHGIDTGAGVIDADYRGPVKVLLFNVSDEDFAISEGDRIAQLVIERIYTPEVVVVEKLSETVRGAGGFGSTGGFGTKLAPINGA